METNFAMSIPKNTPTALTGPRVYAVYPITKGKKIHLTGGHQAKEFDRGLCQKKMKIDQVVDARDLAPFEEYTTIENYEKWCGNCLHRLSWEGLDQRILFAWLPTDNFPLYRNKKPGRFSYGMRIGEYFDNRRIDGKMPPSIGSAPPESEWRVHKTSDLNE